MFLESQIRRVSLNVAALAAILLVFAGLALSVLWRDFASVVAGPLDVSMAGLASGTVPPKGTRFVRIVPEAAPAEVGTEEAGGLTSARYLLIRGAGAALLVKAPAGTGRGPWTGRLEETPSAVAREILDPLVREAKAEKVRFLPFMLDAASYFRLEAVGFFAFYLALSLVSAAWLVVALLRLVDPARHPVAKQFGGASLSADLARSLDLEVRLAYGANEPGAFALTQTWLVVRGTLLLRAWRLTDLTWGHKRLGWYTLSHLPVANNWSVVVYDRWGGAHPIPFGFREARADALLAALLERIPGFLIGKQTR